MLAACAPQAPRPSPAPTGPSYSGLVLAADDLPGVAVAAVPPGPAAQAGLAVGDRILALDGEPLALDALHQRLVATPAGQARRLDVRRGGRTLELELRPARGEDWRGPAELATARPWQPSTSAPPAWFAAPAAEFAALRPSAMPVAAGLAGMFTALAADGRGLNRLPLVRQVFASPGAALTDTRRLLAALEAAADAPQALPAQACAWLAFECRLDAAPAGTPTPHALGVALAALALELDTRLARELGEPRAAALADLDYLARESAHAHLIYAQPEAPRALRAMNLSRHVDGAALLADFARLWALAAAAPAPGGTAWSPPPALAGLVSGGIIGYVTTPAGLIVYGGDGPNRYDMGGLLAVIDAGGDDRYDWPDAAPAVLQLVVDRGGNDSYRARRGGPGGAWLGVAITFDVAGDDHYQVVRGGCGAGLYGVGLLLDGAGDDRYDCGSWSLGAGLYGVGLAIDRGAGADSRVSRLLAQGVGGPGGLGLLLDQGGADLYRANGPVPSVYGTPAVYAGFSQGVGYGFRPQDQGGIGILLDAGGDDRYEGGEFAQGGGYFGGLGILQDRAGDDLYYGQRYAQGFAAHQAAGLLEDQGGNDHYWAAGAAAQGAAWDQGIALLFDAAGDDDYRAGELAQGAAAHQAAALLYDAAGDDVYRATSEVAQGAAAGNGYHFDERAPVASLGLFYDAAGADRYSSGLRDGELRVRQRARGVTGTDEMLGVARDRAAPAHEGE